MVLLLMGGPRWLFYALLYAVSIIGTAEYYTITAADGSKLIRWPVYFLLLLLFFSHFIHQIHITPAIIAIICLLPLAYYMFVSPKGDKGGTQAVGKIVTGPVYAALPLSLLVLIDLMPKGNLWILFLLVVVFTTDTGAFYFGRSFGKRKLYPAVSPSKTWAGAIGGTLSSILAGLVFLHLFPIGRRDWTLVVLILLLSVSAQIGDLAESMIKRNHGFKDSGSILPGHGGILDRIDGLLFSIPVLYLYLIIFLL